MEPTIKPIKRNLGRHTVAIVMLDNHIDKPLRLVEAADESSSSPSKPSNNRSFAGSSGCIDCCSDKDKEAMMVLIVTSSSEGEKKGIGQ